MSRPLPVASGAETSAVVRELLRAHRLRALLTGGVLVLAALAGLAGPLLLGEIVGRVADGAAASEITAPVLVLLGAAVAETVFTGLGFALVPALGQPVLAELRERVVDRALHVPAERVEEAGRGDLISRVGDDVSEVAEALVEALPALATAALTIALTVVGLAALDFRLALAGLCAVPVQLYALRWYVPLAGPAYRTERGVSAQRAQVLLEAASGARAIRALGLGSKEVQRVSAASDESVTWAVRAARIGTGFFSRLNGAELTGVAAILVVGFFLVKGDHVGIGDATAAALLFIRLFDPLNVVLGLVDDIQRAIASLSRLVGVATIEPPAEPAHPAAPRGSGVSIAGLRHAYATGPEVLRGIDLEIQPGERVALVGSSGAGKTTLARVIAGFLEPSSGTVEIGGATLPALGPSATRRAVGLVSQEVHVFTGTLAQDLRLAAPEASDDQLHEALELVEATGWVASLPEGIETAVGAGGATLTAAQAQQLALARLALADTPVAILDEATAEAGSAGARVLERAAARVLRGRTAIVVAHRLTQAAVADRIVVLEGGRVAETGSHDELVGAGGRYATLWAAWEAPRQAGPPRS